MLDIEQELAKAVKHYWKTRSGQKVRQGGASGVKDAGNRAAVTGGKHADRFVTLIADIVRAAGLPDVVIHTVKKTARTLPGYFRPTKEWDVLVVSGTTLVAAVEVKSQVGSFGNNFNNRVEEALGNATDFWAAYAKGLFTPSGRPWLGYLFMLEDNPASTRPTRRINLAPYAVDEVFQEMSYAQRYEELCLRLVRERHYDAACFFTSNPKYGAKGLYAEPNAELGIRNFAISLSARAASIVKIQK